MTGNPFAAITDAETTLRPATHGGWIPARLAGGDSFLARAQHEFREFVLQPEFPCVGARAAFHSGSYALATYGALASDDATAELAQDLFDFTRSAIRYESEYATFVAVFREPVGTTESAFEQQLWEQLQKLHQVDAAKFSWDPEARSDPADPQFSFSFAGQALYVIGMHANSSRFARQFAWPVLIFNPHEQFEQLRRDGKWKRMQQTIRERDVALQGSVNPMLSDFGESTEARQYSGRVVEENWRAPFHPQHPAAAGKCPFHH